MYNFASIGAAGYIVPRHMQAIRDTGNTMVAALDPNDSVGTIDSCFPDGHFLTEFERSDRQFHKRRRQGDNVDYISMCSPNYLPDSHMRFSLRSGSDVICEKPPVLNSCNIDVLHGMKKDTARSYQEILAGRGFGLEENRVAVETVAHIRSAALVTTGEIYPFPIKARG